ncbi:MAG: TolC family protein [Verrucomicrobiota bacterium]
MDPVWNTAALRALLTCSCLVFHGCATISAEAVDRQQRKAEAAVTKRLEARGVELPEAVHPSPASRYADPSPGGKTPPPPDAGQGEPARNALWEQALPKDADGTVRLDRAAAVRAALLNSPDFQREREDLFLSAQDLTVEEHKFELQGGLTSRSNRLTAARAEGAGRGDSQSVDSAAGISKLTKNGGRFLLDMANSVLLSLGGGPDKVVNSAINLSVVQPLLRYGSRKYVMEDLTQAQRNLVANIRRLEQFRRGFYIQTTAGRNVALGPVRGQGEVENPGLLAGAPGGTSGAQEPGGFLGLLLSGQKIRNQESVLQALQDSLAQLEAAFEAGRISNRLQVLQTRQALYNSQSALLTARESWRTQLDNYKISLGLPPSLPVTIHDPLLEQSRLVDPDTTALQKDVTGRLNILRQRDDLTTFPALSAAAEEMLAFRPRIESRLAVAEGNLKEFSGGLKTRQEQLARLSGRPEVSSMGTVAEIFNPKATGETNERLVRTFPGLKNGLLANFDELRKLRAAAPDDARSLTEVRGDLQRLVASISGQLLELSLHQAGSRLETAALETVDLPADTALPLARAQRLDWANAQARLVDSWRKIAVRKEALKPGLDLLVSGRIPTVGNDALDFEHRDGTLNLGVALDVPWDKVDERGAYQESLISYQRSRRDYIRYSDQVTLSLRNTLRVIRLIQVNFEIRRSAVRSAIMQVDLARLRLNEPPKPDQAATPFGATTARDLVSALNDLLNAQNDFQSAWITYDVLRLTLDFELGTMRLDGRGLWLDPGAITADSVTRRLPPEPSLTSIN